MKIKISNISCNLHVLMTRAGYHAHFKGDSYVMRIGNGDFPRFHVYFKQDNDGNTNLNLHLDQTKTAVKWAPKRHRSEYDTQVIQDEAERLQRWIEYYGSHQ